VVILEGASGGSGKLRDDLAQKYPVIALELPGFGSSPENSRSRSAPEIARTTALALALIAPDRYTLVGTSFGANVALWQTLQSPEPVEALILISPTCLLPTGGPIDGTPGGPADRLFAHPENTPGLSPPDAAIDAAIDAPIGANNGATILNRELALAQRLGGDIHDAAAEQRLGEIQCATLVVFGSRDEMVSPRAASIYRANIPNCNVSIVYDAGHAIAAERPEALSGTVVDFVDRRETFVVGYRSSLVNP
jgi:pimeloyl-ACP methyl ester carboxylesterase